MCYACLGLQQYRKVITYGVQALKMERLEPRNRINILHYLYEAHQQVGSTGQAKAQLDALQTEMNHLPKNTTTKVIYNGSGKEDV